MNRYILSMAGSFLAMVVTSGLAFGQHHGSHGSASRPSAAPTFRPTVRPVATSALRNGGVFKFKGGYYYKGAGHNHWSHRRYFANYGCTLYYDPGYECYYYWCQPDECYYPVSYCPYGQYSWNEQ